MAASCPIDSQRVDQSVVRIAASVVAFIALIGLFTQHWLVFLFLSVDFSVRASGKSAFSPIFVFSQQITNALKIKPVLENAGPKRFAAKLGFTLSLVLLTSSLLNIYALNLVLCSILLVCAALESLFSICLGCYAYPYFSKWSRIRHE